MHLEAEVTDEARKMPHETSPIIHSIIIEDRVSIAVECRMSASSPH